MEVDMYFPTEDDWYTHLSLVLILEREFWIGLWTIFFQIFSEICIGSFPFLSEMLYNFDQKNSS